MTTTTGGTVRSVDGLRAVGAQDREALRRAGEHAGRGHRIDHHRPVARDRERADPAGPRAARPRPTPVSGTGWVIVPIVSFAGAVRTTSSPESPSSGASTTTSSPDSPTWSPVSRTVTSRVPLRERRPSSGDRVVDRRPGRDVRRRRATAARRSSPARARRRLPRRRTPGAAGRPSARVISLARRVAG